VRTPTESPREALTCAPPWLRRQRKMRFRPGLAVQIHKSLKINRQRKLLSAPGSGSKAQLQHLSLKPGRPGVYYGMKKNEPTSEEINAGTRPCTLKADGSRWVFWEKGAKICCKWIDGGVPEKTPCRMKPEEFEKRYDA